MLHSNAPLVSKCVCRLFGAKQVVYSGVFIAILLNNEDICQTKGVKIG